MTAKDHNKILGTLFLLFGWWHFLLLIVTFLYVASLPEVEFNEESTAGDAFGSIAVLLQVGFAIISALLAAPSVIVACGIYLRWRWVRVGSIIAAVLAFPAVLFGFASETYSSLLRMVFPFGTAWNITSVSFLLFMLLVIVMLTYAIVFLFSKAGKSFYNSAAT